MKVCKKTHTDAGFGEVPAGALFEDDHWLVAKNPSAFKSVKADDAPADDEVK